MSIRLSIGRETCSELVRFVVVGGLSFAADIGTLVFLQEILFKEDKERLFVSIAIAFSVSLAIHYVLTSLWVFRNHKVNTMRQHFISCILFFITNVIGLGLNELLLWIGVVRLGLHYVIVKVGSAAIVMVWNFLCQKTFIFTGKNCNEH